MKSVRVMNLKKHILSWRKILIDIFGSPVEYIPNEIPVNYNSHENLFPWGLSTQRIGDWFSHCNFMIGLDHVTSPTTFCILFKLNGLVHQQLIISVRDTGRYQSGVNYRELKTFFHALKNRINLPLCINYEWANELLKAALQDDDTW